MGNKISGFHTNSLKPELILKSEYKSQTKIKYLNTPRYNKLEEIANTKRTFLFFPESCDKNLAKPKLKVTENSKRNVALTFHLE